MIRLEKTPEGNYICPDDPGEPGYEGNPPRRSVTDEECGVLQALAWKRRVLEIGVGLGVSTRAFADVALSVTAIESDPWVWEHVIGKPKDWPRRVFFYRPEAARLALEGPYGLAFIDGNHDSAWCREDILFCLRLKSSSKMVFVLHDTNLCGVRRAAESFGTLVRMDTKGHLGMLLVGK